MAQILETKKITNLTVIFAVFSYLLISGCTGTEVGNGNSIKKPGGTTTDQSDKSSSPENSNLPESIPSNSQVPEQDKAPVTGGSNSGVSKDNLSQINGKDLNAAFADCASAFGENLIVPVSLKIDSPVSIEEQDLNIFVMALGESLQVEENAATVFTIKKGSAPYSIERYKEGKLASQFECLDTVSESANVKLEDSSKSFLKRQVSLKGEGIVYKVAWYLDAPNSNSESRLEMITLEKDGTVLKLRNEL